MGDQNLRLFNLGNAANPSLTYFLIRWSQVEDGISIFGWYVRKRLSSVGRCRSR